MRFVDFYFAFDEIDDAQCQTRRSDRKSEYARIKVIGVNYFYFVTLKTATILKSISPRAAPPP